MRGQWLFAGLLTVVTAGTGVQGQALMAGKRGDDQTLTPGGSDSFDMSQYEEAQAFTAANNFTATRVEFWTAIGDGQTPITNDGFQGVFRWAIYSTDGGHPGTMLYGGNAVPTLLKQTYVQPSYNQSEWSFDLPDVALSGNTEYWMSIRNTNANGDYTESKVSWMSDIFAGLTTPASRSRLPGEDWTENRPLDVHAFSDGNRLSLGIYGDPMTTTPEPSDFVLLVTGLVPLVTVIRRRRG